MRPGSSAKFIVLTPALPRTKVAEASSCGSIGDGAKRLTVTIGVHRTAGRFRTTAGRGVALLSIAYFWREGFCGWKRKGERGQ